MTNSKTQIVVTIGPSSANAEIIYQMIMHDATVFRLNFGWGNLEEHANHVNLIKEAENRANRKVKIIFDLPGPRIQKNKGHTYDKNEVVLLTENDHLYIQFGVQNKIDYFALSFVGNKADVVNCREIIKQYGGTQKIIAKIEREKAMNNLDEIIEAFGSA